ncbi:E3 SUMO-protein ligase ZBED1-like [Girardinichthys multiradiatus]|uniref:E3 SUMO-protein ligase ZBED1-like n=1 Tax=Girardinichthys multiradiatus TaxID=208333 RepID=UPI001FABE1A2|nr:E3 SUMO-protein ligase ZBED1-like [Girardinichthys multiradiatus]
MASRAPYELVAKKNTTSAVWQYFGFLANEKGEPVNTDEAICKLCDKNVTARDGNTSNLRTHLRVNHPLTAARMHLAPSSISATVSTPPADTDAGPKPTTKSTATYTQSTIIGAFGKTTKYKRDSVRWKTCTDAVTKYLAKEMVSFHTVEKKSFKDMVKVLDAQYELPGRKHFSQTAVPHLYIKVRDEVQVLLSEAESYSLTTDMWSSVNMTPYMSLTVHTITPEWKLESKCLQTTYFPESHTADNLAAALRVALQDWQLDEKKLSAITTDNAANISAAIRSLEWLWLNCFGHNLNLAVTNAMHDNRQKTERALGVCRCIVGAFSHSWQRKSELHKEQVELGLPEHSLITDCATRWGSKLAMVERILEQAQGIRHVLSDDRRSSLSLTWQDTDVLKAVHDALKPVGDFTDILSGEHYVTSSSILPILQLCRDNVLALSEYDLQLTKSIKTGILKKLEAKYESDSVRKLMRKCTFLDPRYRGGYETDASALAETKAELQAEIVNLENQAPAGPVVIIRVEEGEAQAEPPRKRVTLRSLLQKQADAVAGPIGSVEDRVGAEITAYCLEPVIQADKDPLLWWKCAARRFPLMSRVARKHLCVCATSSPSERVFSTAGKVVSPQRSLLNPEIVNMLVFLAKNLD